MIKSVKNNQKCLLSFLKPIEPIYDNIYIPKIVLKTLKHDKEGVVKLTVSNNVNTIHSYFSPMSGRTITIDTGFSLSRYAFLSILKFMLTLGF